MPSNAQHSSETRERLLKTAILAFGRRDYDGVAIRQIVEKAGVNIAAISYHFGGKQGLYTATVEYLAERIHDGMAEYQSQVSQVLKAGGKNECADLLCNFTGLFIDTLLTGEYGDSAPGIIFREQHQPTEAYEILYQKLLQPMHNTLSSLIACHRGEAETSRSSLLLAQALLGQCVIFRIGRTTLLRRFDQADYTSADIDLIKHQLRAYCRSMLATTPNPED
jgi:AcrR family transcriptional regulator